MPAVLAASVETCVLLVLEQWLWSSLVCCYFADKTAAIGRVGPRHPTSSMEGWPSISQIRASQLGERLGSYRARPEHRRAVGVFCRQRQHTFPVRRVLHSDR